MTPPSIAPDQLVSKINRLRLDYEKARSQADRAFNRFMEDPADDKRLSLWEQALDRASDLVEEESRLIRMREDWKMFLASEQSELRREIDAAKSHLDKLTGRRDRNEGYLRALYFG